MGIRFSILASGSTGNATVVENDEVKLIVDVGLSLKKTEQMLESRNTEAQQIAAILITHEHSDHIRGVGAMARKYNLPIYANEGTWGELDRLIGDVDDRMKRVFRTGESIDFGSMKVESYAISHDAAEPVGFCFYDREEKLSLATDLGYVSPNVREKIADSDVLVIESNHDIEMLRIGRYPWNVKRRILGDLGHLSNEAAGKALCDLVTDRTKRVYLAHLSRDHNLMDLARLTVNSILESSGVYSTNRRLRLMDTHYDRPTLWDVLDHG